MSANPEKSPASVPRPAAKPRNPIERLVVWGGILILLVLVGIEYASSRSQSAVADTLMAKLRTYEIEGGDLKAADVKAAVNGKTPRVLDVTDKNLLSGAKRAEVYSWFTLSPLKRREIYVYYGIGEDPDVLSVTLEEDKEIVVFHPPTPEQLEAAEAFINSVSRRPEPESDEEAKETPESKEVKDAPESSEPADASPAKE